MAVGAVDLSGDFAGAYLASLRVRCCQCRDDSALEDGIGPSPSQFSIGILTSTLRRTGFNVV